jgi:hypothetical protein
MRLTLQRLHLNLNITIASDSNAPFIIWVGLIVNKTRSSKM